MDSQTTRAESELERERQRLLEQLLAEEGLDAASEPVIAPRDRTAAAPLSYAQEVLWLLDRATPGLTAYNTPLARRVRGTIDIPALERALSTVVQRHEALRTVFAPSGDGAVQDVLNGAPVKMTVHDVSMLQDEQRELAAIAALRREADTPFDLASEPGFRAALARIAPDDHVLLLLTHHIVSDAWSYGVIFRELGELYDAERSGATPDLPPAELHFGDYAAWQRETLRGDALESGLGYWRARLAELPVLELPTVHARPASQGFAGARRTVVLPASLHAGVRSLAQENGATTYMALLTAYAAVLRQYSGQDDIVVGSAVAGRTSREMEEMVGYFSQALPMRVRFDGDPTVNELLTRVSETVLGAFEHQDTPLEPLVLELQAGRAQSHAPLFRVVLTMQDTLGAELRLGDAAISPVELDAAGTKFDLTILATERTDGLELALWYRTDLFTAEYAERFLGHVRTVLEAMVAEPARAMSSVSILTPAEREALASWNATDVDEGAPATLIELFEAQVARVGDRTAVVAEDGSMTYAELDAAASRLAGQLRAAGVNAGDTVGLGADRSVHAIAGLLGILKAGASYVPLPPELPAARRADQMRQSGAKVLVALQAHSADAPAGVRVVALDGPMMVEAVGDVARDPASAAYVLFTSGSTGAPKGVVVTNANAVHYARAVSRVLGGVPAEEAGDGFAALDGWHFGLVSTLGADLGNTCLLPALLSGGTLHVLAKGVTTEPTLFADYVKAHPLDVVKITPNHFSALSSTVLPSKWLVLGGEALRPEVARTLLRDGDCRVLNHYGPTETTVGVLTHEVTSRSIGDAMSHGAQTIPLGLPLANTQVYVMNRDGHEQPVGIPGEIWIGGDGVAQGYIGRDDLTAERFVVRPGVVGNDTLYRSGDRARRLPDGTIEFLGRIDDQVKVRGYRVELGEIEQLLRAHAGVANCIVVLRTPEAGDATLAAYVVAKTDGYAVSHSDRPTSEKLTEWLAAQLPEYMVPSAVVLLDELPLTANGKVDRAKLPEPGASATAAPSFVAPRTQTEVQLAAIWADVLKREQVGVTDNFLALGGHSLLAIRLLGKISKAFGVRLPLRSLFETPTVEQIAVAVDAAVAAK
ncbi:MAG: amino acid adenylation domain-containing protein [Gemmatimonadaceae bacterium]